MTSAGKDRDERRGARGEAARVMGVGLQFAAAIVLFLLLGQWLDERLGTEPWLLIAGVMVGAAGGFYSLYRQLAGGSKRGGAGSGAARPGDPRDHSGGDRPPRGGAGGGAG
jgi:ATP synthase protein I